MGVGILVFRLTNESLLKIWVTPSPPWSNFLVRYQIALGVLTATCYNQARLARAPNTENRRDQGIPVVSVPHTHTQGDLAPLQAKELDKHGVV